MKVKPIIIGKTYKQQTRFYLDVLFTFAGLAGGKSAEDATENAIIATSRTIERHTPTTLSSGE